MGVPFTPPTQKGRDFETKALGIRDFAGLRDVTDPLDPFELAHYAGLVVMRFDEVSHLLSDEARERLLGSGSDKWSGGAVAQPLPDGKKLIILNPVQGLNRQRATLMEEISHVFLGHQPSRLGIETMGKNGEVVARDYHPEIEEEAYGVGAAALVPYLALVRFLSEGKTIREMAKHFEVSRDLVEYRLRVSRLWDEYSRYNEKWPVGSEASR